MPNNAKNWLLRANSNLDHAIKVDKNNLAAYGGNIYFEDLCFDLQQCVEKSLKALLVYYNIEFPKIHSISKLVDLLKENNIIFPEELLPALDLTIYAVATRYPAFEDEISEQEYKEALEIAENVYEWVQNQLN
jgi:HEPN domain-containing protein